MPLVVDVPLNTMLADLDETLRVLLKRELARHGFDGVEVAFDAPGPRLVEPALGPDGQPLPLRPARVARVPPDRLADRPLQRPPPRDPAADDHGVLLRGDRLDAGGRGRAPAALARCSACCSPSPSCPEDALAGRLAETAQRFAIEGKIGQPKSDGKADFWSAVGGQYKASLDYVVTLACESGIAYERGPEVRTQTMGTRQLRRPARRRVTEMHRFGGKVLDADGAPLPDVWITLPELGLFASSDRQGRFVLQRVPAGHAHARRAHPRRRRGDGGDRRARRRPRPHGRARRSAPGRRRRADRMGKLRCPNGCPRPSGARGPRPEMLGD